MDGKIYRPVYYSAEEQAYFRELYADELDEAAIACATPKATLTLVVNRGRTPIATGA